MFQKIWGVIFFLAFSPAAWAYDFKADGIYYTILSSDDKTVEVTYKSYSDRGYSGDVTIPATVSYNGTVYSVTAIGFQAFYDCTGLTSITIPNSVTSIGSSAFCRCTDLTEVTIPESVTAIGNFVFSGCEGLTSITIPESVTSIGYEAFWGCSGLKSVTIPESVTSIGDRAFSDCYGLTAITIPESVTAIGYMAFSACKNLTSVTIPNSVTSIGNDAFYRCTGLTSVTIPNSVTTIGDMAFYRCTGLTSITIPNSVQTIGEGAFSGCSGLTEFKGKFASDNGRCLIVNDTLKAFAPSGLTQYTIPDEVKVIGEWAFAYCNGLTSVTTYNPTPVDIDGKSVFYNVNCSNCTLYVPAESVEKYKAAEGWKEFGEILPIAESSAITEIQQDNADGHVTVYNLQGVLVLETNDAADLKTLQNGAYIVNGKTMIIAR